MPRGLTCLNWQLTGKYPDLTSSWIGGVVLAPSTVEVLQEFDVVGASVEGFRRIFRSLLPPDTPFCFGDSLGNEGVTTERFAYVPELMESEETLRAIGYNRRNAHHLWRLWESLDEETKRREYHGDNLSSAYSFFSFAILAMECKCVFYKDANDDSEWKEILENVGVNRSLINEVMDPEHEIARRNGKGRTLVAELISANCRALCYVRWASYWRASEEFASQVFDLEFGNAESSLLPTPKLTKLPTYTSAPSSSHEDRGTYHEQLKLREVNRNLVATHAPAEVSTGFNTSSFNASSSKVKPENATIERLASKIMTERSYR